MKSLFLVCHLLVLYGTAVSLRQYFYFSQLMNWTAAQTYCRQHYKDLATITTKEEQEKAVKVMDQTIEFVWIGLNRTAPNVNIWQWSGGEKFDFAKWKTGEPNDYMNKESCTATGSYGWYDYDCEGKNPFLCYRNLMLVKENKTWEEALNHCRSYYTDLAYVNSETLLNLLKMETAQTQTVSMWTGLRFLNGKWICVNGGPQWSLESLPSCPVQPYRCGAYNSKTYIWENRNCNEELNFLCYH